MSISKDMTVHVPDRETHIRLLKEYVDEAWKDRDVVVDWEWSGPGTYRIHEHVDGAGLPPCVSLKWEGV